MKKPVLFAVVLSLSLMPAACYEPVHYSAKDDLFLQQHAGTEPWHKIALLPFSGDPVFRRTSAEWFAHLIDKHNLFEIIGPSVSQIELGKKGVRLGDADIPIETAQEAGRILGTDGVIVGSLKASTTERSGIFWREVVAGVSIVNVSTGQVVATSARSGAPQTGMNPVDAAISAAGQVANDLLPVLYALAGRTWTPPPKKQDPEP